MKQWKLWTLLDQAFEKCICKDKKKNNKIGQLGKLARPNNYIVKCCGGSALTHSFPGLYLPFACFLCAHSQDSTFCPVLESLPLPSDYRETPSTKGTSFPQCSAQIWAVFHKRGSV